MNQQKTLGIVLARTNYGEADRIITVLTPDHGKLRLMAKGVRRPKSKLAGGIELFSVSQLVFIRGRGDISTLVSSRLAKHFGRIVQDITRVQLGYELIKTVNKITEDEPEASYFELAEQTFAALDEPNIGLPLIQTWFEAQLLARGGLEPNLATDSDGHKLTGRQFSFDNDSMSFRPAEPGRFKPDHIKFLRLLFGRHQPKALQQVQGSGDLLAAIQPLVKTLFQQLN
jgi:DNA repair protein RecO (recombination protein O)